MRTGEGIDRTTAYLAFFTEAGCQIEKNTVLFKNVDCFERLPGVSQTKEMRRAFEEFKIREKEEKKADKIMNELLGKRGRR